MKRIIIAIITLIIVTLFSTTAMAASYYSGVNKTGNFTGISASIKAPSAFPTVGTSGESCWITNQATSNGKSSWVQTGLRYYKGYSAMKTYFEYNYAPTGDYNIRNIGTHSKGASIAYKLQYNSTNVMWDAYIGGAKVDSYNMGRAYANVQAQGESHNNSQVYLGPFVFSDLKTRTNGSSTWVLNTNKAPTANSPYTYTVHNKYYKYTVQGGP